MDANKSLVNEAVSFAARAHEGQVRKGSGMPYIVHPMEAAAICSTFTDDLEVIAAAVLHDVVEDTDVTVEEVRELFGERVAALVAGESEDKREGSPPAETWRLRKEESIEHLKRAEDPGVRMVCLGDKLSNIRSIQRDYDSLGEEFWQRFNQKDPAQHAWYYRTIADLLKGELGETEAWHEYAHRVRTVFGPCGYSEDRSNRVSLLDLKRWCDHLLSVGVAPDAKVVIDRTEGFEGYTYANDLHLADKPEGRYEDHPLILIGTYVQKGRDVMVR